MTVSFSPERSYIVCFLFMSFGLFSLIESVVLREPYKLSGTKHLKKAYSQNILHQDIWLLHPFRDFLVLFSKLIYLLPGEELTLSNKLSRLHIPYTAKAYVARGYCGMLVGVLFMLLSYLLGFPLGSIFGLGIGIYLYLRNRDMVEDGIGEINRLARQELPQFVRAINTSIGTERDLIRIIERYMKIAGPGLHRDLEILLLDLNTGNVEVALQKFDARVALPEFSQLVSILINIERGIDQSAALTNLASTLSMMAREHMRRELALRPGKMTRAMLPAAFIAILAMFYVFIVSVINHVSNIYG